MPQAVLILSRFIGFIGFLCAPMSMRSSAVKTVFTLTSVAGMVMLCVACTSGSSDTEPWYGDEAVCCNCFGAIERRRKGKEVDGVKHDKMLVGHIAHIV